MLKNGVYSCSNYHCLFKVGKRGWYLHDVHDYKTLAVKHMWHLENKKEKPVDLLYPAEFLLNTEVVDD